MKLHHSKRVKARQMLKKPCGAPTMPTPVVLYTGFTHARWASNRPSLQQIPKSTSEQFKGLVKSFVESRYTNHRSDYLDIYLGKPWGLEGTTTGRHTSAEPNMEEVDPLAKGS